MSFSRCVLEFQVNAATIRTSLSAVRHIGPHLWLGCDETATLERLTYHGDRADQHQHFQLADFLDLPRPEDEEVDVEGIAYTDYYLWFVGSHSLKRKSYKADRPPKENLKRLRTLEKEENRYTLGRIPLVNGQLHKCCPHPDNPDVILTAARRLRDDRYLKPFIKADIPGKDNGLDIEGLAVMGDRLLLGLRGPVLRGWAILLEVELKADEPGTLKLAKIGPDKGRYLRHFLDLQGLGIRDLCPWGDQLLILAGPTMALDGVIKIFSVPLADIQSGKPLLQPTVLAELPHTLGGDRAEGLTLLNPHHSQELLVVYDAPLAARLEDEHGVVSDRLPLP